MQSLMVECGELSALIESDTRPSENRECGYKYNRFTPMCALKLLFVPYQAMSFPLYFQGGVHRLESVEEYNELMVQNGDPRARILEVSRDGRKHSLPQLLESSSTAQVGSAVELLAFSCSHR